MQHDDNAREQREEQDELEGLDEVTDGELRPGETWSAGGPDGGSSPRDERVDQGGRDADSSRRSGSNSESERSDRTHQAPHENHVGRADWAVEGSEGGGDPGGPPRRGSAGDGSRRKKSS